MRSTTLLWTLLVAALFIISCKKEKTASPGPNRLPGNWEMEMQIYTEYRNDTLNERDTTTYEADKIIYSFTDDSLVVFSNGVPSKKKYSYKITGNDLVLRSGNEGYYLLLTWYGDNRMSYAMDETWTGSSGVRYRSVDESFFNRK